MPIQRYVYRVLDDENRIVLQTTDRKEAVVLAENMHYARIETRQECPEGPLWDGNNFGCMRYIRSEEF